MLADLFPATCSRRTVFVSYASEQNMRGEEIAQALKNAGHVVFFDRDSIPPGGDYNDRIRRAVQSADVMVFLASRHSIASGRFTLSELQFAKERWPSPAGTVIPVIVDDGIEPADLPVYLRSVSVMRPAGNLTTEIVAAVNRTRKIGPLCRAVTAGSGLALAAAFYAMVGASSRGGGVDIALLPPDKIHFRSLADAPLKAGGQSDVANWADTAMTITVMPVAYSHRTEPGPRVRILQETVDLDFAGATTRYRAINVVEITDALCGERWFCIKANAGPETLEPGRAINRETLFNPVDLTSAVTWSRFVDAVLADPKPAITVTYRAKVEVPDGRSVKQIEKTVTCVIDSSRMRSDLVAAKFQVGTVDRPVFTQSDCLPSKPA